MRASIATTALLAAGLVGCSSGGADTGAASSASPSAPSSSASTREGGAQETFPDVQDAVVEASGSGFDVDATISSPYDSPERYADAFRVRGQDGTVYGVRELTHDHADEQPFTRTLNGADIPDDVDEVVVEGRDQVSGWGGATVTVPVPHG